MSELLDTHTCDIIAILTLHTLYKVSFQDLFIIICNTLRGRIKGYIALLPGQYLDIAREGGFQLSFDPPFDPTFHL